MQIEKANTWGKETLLFQLPEDCSDLLIKKVLYMTISIMMK